MAAVQELLAEFKHETANTRKILERVPDGKDDWAPHDKSMKLNALANHVAELTQWVDFVLLRDQIDFAAGDYVPNKSANNAERLKFFDAEVAKAIATLEKTSEADLDQIWSLKFGDRIIFAAPKKVALRGSVFSHIIHHRAQLGVYLRLLGVAVPGIYGPTADEPFS